jgi:hypothetical protein
MRLLPTFLVFHASWVEHSSAFSIRGLQDACGDQAEVSLESYFLVDFIGMPRMVNGSGLAVLQESIINAYNGASSCNSSYRVLDSVAVIQDAVNSYGDSDQSDIAGTATEQEFPYLFRAQGRCTGCSASSSMLISAGGARRSLSLQDSPEKDYSKTNEGSLRKTQETGGCTCEAPLKSVFLSELREDQETFNIQGIHDILDVTELDFRPDCEPAEATKFASTVLLTFKVDGILTSEEEESLKELFIESYYSANALNADICDPHFRQVMAVIGYPDISDESNLAVQHPFGDSYVSMIFYVAGECQDCDSRSALFDKDGSNNLRRLLGAFRRVQDATTEEDMACLCPLDVPSRSSTEEEFIQEYSAALKALLFEIRLTNLTELKPVLCSADITPFSKTVIVELEVCDEIAIKTDIDALEAAFVSSYNRLAMEYCDPYFRTLETAKIVDQGRLTPEGNLPVEIEVTGMCRGEECDDNMIGIYDFPTLPVFVNRLLLDEVDARRHLQNTETCYCKVQTIADRAPSEAGFIEAYQELISSLNLTCVESIADCQFGSVFKTALFLSFDNTTDNTTSLEQFEDEIEASVLVALNSLYESTDEEVCNPEFRIFETVEIRFGVSINIDGLEDRRLEGDPFIRALQLGNANNTTDTTDLAPSMAPTSAPTIGFASSSINALLSISGICNGCENDVFLSNQVLNNRRKLPPPVPEDQRVPRFLQEKEGEEAMSNCYCPLNTTIEDDPPTSGDFELLLQNELDNKGVPLVLQEAVEVNVEDCIPTLLVELASYVVVTIDLGGGPSLSDNQIGELGQGFMESYNSVNGVICGSLSREVSTVSSREVSTVLFDSEYSVSAESIVYAVTGSCRECTVDAKFFDTGVALKDDVFEVYKSYIETKGPTGVVLVDVQEVNVFDCEAEATVFTKLVTIELEVVCDLAPELSDEQKLAIAGAFVSTYNSLGDDFCDPVFRTLTGAQVERVGDIRDGNNLPIELLVFGECRGCDTVNVDIYELPSTISSIAGRRLSSDPDISVISGRALQAETCFCDAQAPQRGPLESEFIVAFQPVVGNLTLDCISTCSDCLFGSSFDTTIILEFEEDPDNTVPFENYTETITETFINTINTFYETDDESCNPDFRVFVNTTASADSFIYNGIDLNETDVNQERLLSVVVMRRHAQENTTMDGNFTSMAPSSAPTFGAGPGFVYVLLFASGICNGCPNDLFLSDQVSDQVSNRRQLQTAIDPFRELQDVNGAESNCFCQVGSTIVENQLTNTEATILLQAEFEEAGLPPLNDIDEPQKFSCDEEITFFMSTFTFEFSALAGVTLNEVDDLGQLMATVYNTMIANYCDPLTRQVVSIIAEMFASLSPERRLQAGCENYVATYNVYGECRGCVDGVPLLDDDGSDSATDATDGESRRLLEVLAEKCVPTTLPGRRRLEGSELCYCTSDFPSRAPSLSEFSVELAKLLPDYDLLPNICGLPGYGCPIVPSGSGFGFSLSLGISRNDDECLTDLDLVALQEIFLGSINSYMQSTYGPCEATYVQLFSVGTDGDLSGCVARRELSTKESSSTAPSSNELGGFAPPRILQTTQVPVLVAFVLEGTCIDTICPSPVLDEVTLAAGTSGIEGAGYTVIDQIDFPSSLPSEFPSSFPSEFPSSFPSEFPSSFPSAIPTTQASSSIQPSSGPSSPFPSSEPSKAPSIAPPCVTIVRTVTDSAVNYLWEEPIDFIPTEVTTDAGFPAWLVSDEGIFFEYIYDDTNNFLTVAQGEGIEAGHVIIWTVLDTEDPDDCATWVYVTYGFATGYDHFAEVDLTAEAVSNDNTIIAFVTYLGGVDFEIFFGPTPSAEPSIQPSSGPSSPFPSSEPSEASAAPSIAPPCVTIVRTVTDSAVNYLWEEPIDFIPTEVTTDAGFPAWLVSDEGIFFEYIYDDTNNFLTVAQGEGIEAGHVIIWTVLDTEDPDDCATWVYVTYGFATGYDHFAEVDLTAEAVSNDDTIIAFVTYLGGVDFEIFFGPTPSAAPSIRPSSGPSSPFPSSSPTVLSSPSVPSPSLSPSTVLPTTGMALPSSSPSVPSPSSSPSVDPPSLDPTTG